MMRFNRLKLIPLLASLLILLLTAACGSSASNSSDPAANSAAQATVAPDASPVPEASPQQLVQLTISAAASLTESLNEIETAFETAHPNIKINYNFGASGTLEKQIEQGAPADMFLSASAKNMNALVDQGLVSKDQTQNLLGNSLVVIVPKGGKDSAVRSITDLKQDGLGKIAIGIPESVPAGQYAQQALTKENLWDELQSRLVQAKDVKAVLQDVETGNADAGFVYRTDALASSKADIAFEVDPSSYSPILYPAGIILASKHPQEVEQFYQYLQSDEAIAVFQKHGFTIPK